MALNKWQRTVQTRRLNKKDILYIAYIKCTEPR